MTLQNTLTGDENFEKPQDMDNKAQLLLKLLESKGVSLEALESALVQGKLDDLISGKRGEMKQTLASDAELQSALQEVCRASRFFKNGSAHQVIVNLPRGASLKDTLVAHGLQKCGYTSRNLFFMSQQNNSPFRLELAVVESRMAMSEFEGISGFLLTDDDHLFIVDRTAHALTIHCDVKTADYRAQ